MTIRVFLASAFFFCLVWVKPTPDAKAEKTKQSVAPKPLDSSVHKAIDTIEVLKAESEELKIEVEDKVDELKYQQRELVRVQRQLDSIERRIVQR